MEQSILLSTKKNLNLDKEYDAFDHDIITFINSTFSVLHDLGIGPDDGFMIEGPEEVWADYISTNNIALNQVKSYVYLKVRMLFDPPQTSFLIEAMEKQVREHEWRLNSRREVELYEPTYD